MMIRRLLNTSNLPWGNTVKFAYIAPKTHSQTHHKPGLTAKRIIKCISERLNRVDPERWNGVPFSFQTHWRDEAGFADIEASIQVHEALEHEFGIEVKDRNILIQDVEMAYYVITQHHDSL